VSTIAFEYVAADASGARRRGTIEARGEQEAYRRLSLTGLTPLRIKPARAKPVRGRGRVKTRDLVQFTYQFSVLLSAGIPLAEGLRGIGEQETNAALKAVLLDVAARIESGQPVAAAMEEHRAVFGDVYIETMRAAEQGGSMSKCLEHLSEMLERSQETTQQVKGALIYPACVITVLSLGVAFLITFIIPKFAHMFQERGVELPIFTRALMFLGEAAQAWWWVYLPAAVAAVVVARRTWANPRGRAAIDRGLHRVPYFKRILQGLAISRFARVFGISLSSGLGLIECLRLSARATGRPMLMEDAARMADQVRAGRRLSECLPDCGYLTPFARRMIAAGEDSAQLPKMCSVVARHYERETTHLAKNVATVIEPVMVVGIAGVVLVVALSIFLPMWNMVNLVK
jgi:type II secretory pathway component PulF